MTPWEAAVVGVVSTILVLVSSWLLIGKQWITTAGEQKQQIAVNTKRLDAIEEQAKATINMNITRAEHEELLARIFRLESLEMEGKP